MTDWKRSYDKQIAQAYAQLVMRLDYIATELERIGENDMGVLTEGEAGRFHDATDLLRDLSRDLKQSLGYVAVD